MPDRDPKAETHAGPGEGRPASASAQPDSPPPATLPAALTLRDVQALIASWMRSQGWEYWHPLSQLARMTEELGEVARLVNHLYGEKPKKPDEPAQDLGLELADLLYTMICLANAQGVDLQVALERVLEKYRGRDAERYPRAGAR